MFTTETEREYYPEDADGCETTGCHECGKLSCERVECRVCGEVFCGSSCSELEFSLEAIDEKCMLSAVHQLQTDNKNLRDEVKELKLTLAAIAAIDPAKEPAKESEHPHAFALGMARGKAELTLKFGPSPALINGAQLATKGVA